MQEDFFNKHSLKSSDSFSVKEIALGTISYLMRTGKIRSEDDLRKCVESSSFLSEYIMENQIEGLAGLLKPTESKILTTAYLGKLNQEGFLRQKEQQFLEKALKTAEEELEEKRKKAL